jgi:predicted dehydrogenase
VSKLRAGIIGYGLAGRVFHAPLIAATPGLAVSAIVTADSRRSAQAAAEHPGASVVPSAEHLWARSGELDLVVVATPNHLHAELAGVAVDRGLAVVVDKPLAVSSEEAEALVARAEARGALLTTFHNRRWDSDQLTLDELIGQGALGEVIRYESRFERWRPEPDPTAWRQSEPPERGGGQLLDLGVHLVDQALHRFGPVTQVYAEIAGRRGTAGDDDAFLALQHASGTISHLRASAITAAPGPRLRVLGSAGAYLVSAVDSQEDALRDGARPGRDEPWGVEPRERQGRLVSGERSVPVSVPGAWPRFYALLEQALRDGGPPPVDPRDAVAALRVIELARRSAAERAVIGSPA